MASLQDVSNLTGDSDARTDSPSKRTGYRRLGLVNGLLIGLALAFGAWALFVLTLIRVPITVFYGSIIAATLLVTLLCGVAGWLTARIGRVWATVLIWLLAAFASVAVITFQSSYIRSFVVWLLDRRFWGRSIYEASQFPDVARMILALSIAGFFIYLVVVMLALLQDARLKGMQSVFSDKGRFTLRAGIRLLLPLPFVALAGFITNDFVGEAHSIRALPQLQQVFDVGRTYEGDLFELSLKENLNYNAIRGVREQLSPNYKMLIGETDSVMSASYIIAHFDNGAWINCRLFNDQLSFCYDASLPYTIGLGSLITGQPPAEDCRGCLPNVDEDLADWLQQQGERFSGQPQVTRLNQQGSHVLMRAEAPDGSAAVECWFEGNTRVRLVSCSDASE